MSDSPLVRAAGEYLTFGLSIIALSGKAPNGRFHRQGLNQAISGAPESADDWDLLRSVFDDGSTTGVGILTNFPYYVIDIDGEDGAIQFRDIAGPDLGEPNWVAMTHHGLHLWFADTKPRTTRKLGPKLDLKGVGGYVAAPPSAFGECSEDPCPRPHMSAEHYEWLLDPYFGHPMEAPDALTKLLDEQDFEMERRLATRQANKRVRHEQFEDGKWWATWGFEGVIKAMREAPEGKRNAVLYWATFTLMEDDADEEDYDALRTAALDAGLTARETRLTMRSARRAAGE